MKIFYTLLIVSLTACASNISNVQHTKSGYNIALNKNNTQQTSQVDESKKANGKLVANADEFNSVISKAKPGDTIVLKNGRWLDSELLITASGIKEKNITVTVETKGRVILSGQSSLKIGGDYIHVNGLVFKNGYSPGRSTIAFSKNSKTLANNSRISEIVIDSYSNTAELNETKDWISLFGTDNRVDHCHFVNKKERGVVINVSRSEGQGYVNNHLIDHNYFGVREYFGANGAEIIRVGSWPESQNRSETIIE